MCWNLAASVKFWSVRPQQIPTDFMQIWAEIFSLFRRGLLWSTVLMVSDFNIPQMISAGALFTGDEMLIMDAILMEGSNMKSGSGVWGWGTSVFEQAANDFSTCSFQWQTVVRHCLSKKSKWVLGFLQCVWCAGSFSGCIWAVFFTCKLLTAKCKIEHNGD